MFTIRHVEPDGSERLHEVESVDRTKEGRLVFIKQLEISTGKAFVMNDAGHTVAVYDFDKQKQEEKR